MDLKAQIQALKEQLKWKDFELNAILEITMGINTNQSIQYMLSLYEFILKEQLCLDKFALYNKSENWNCILKSGIKGRLKNINAERDLCRFQDVTMIASSSNKELAQFDAVIPVVHEEIPIAYLLIKYPDSDNLLPYKSSDDVSFIQTLTNIIVVAFENKRMNQESLVQERLKKELEVASEMQKLLFPDKLPSDKRIDLAATYITRHQVGGDYYDFIPINDDEFIICIADVSGKGIGAAMLMANFQAMVHTLLSIRALNMEALIIELNEKVMNTAKGEKFITFFIAHYNTKTRRLKYVNAGHNQPILTNGKKAQFLSKGAIGLGMMETIPFIEPGELTIGSNSTLILYTDGIVELQNKSGLYFETDRLIRLVHNFYPLKMEDLNNLIFSKLDEFRQSEDLVDDTAIFSCRIF